MIVLLESDENIRKTKGEKRPINKQENRAIFLSKLKMVDFVIKLPFMKNDDDYLNVIKEIKPEIIAVSSDDKKLDIKKKEAKEVGAKVMIVSKKIARESTSRIIKLIEI